MRNGVYFPGILFGRIVHNYLMIAILFELLVGLLSFERFHLFSQYVQLAVLGRQHQLHIFILEGNN